MGQEERGLLRIFDWSPLLRGLQQASRRLPHMIV